MNEREHTLLHQAITAASLLTGLDISFERAPGLDEKSTGCIITIRGQGGEVRLPAEIVRNLTKAAIGPVAAKIRNLGGPGLLVTPYVNRNMAERLKTLGVPFLDVSGNLFINVPPYFIYVVGQARVEEASVVQGTAFNPMGLQVIFTLLCMPERVSCAYRDIAEDSGVSLGTVSNTLAALERGGFVVDKGNRGRALANVGELSRRWVMEYAERLRPKLFMGRYSPSEPGWSAQGGTGHFLGGETAAALLTEHLKPTVQTFYLKGELKEFAVANRLKKDPQGTIECLKAFWRFEYPWEHGHIAPPLIIYADLLASGDPRNLETAEIIHERFLTSLFRTR
jgi:hypothetical protein